MKLKTRVKRVGRNGEIKIPRDYMKALCLSPGQEVKLKLMDNRLLIEPVKEVVVSKKESLKDPVEALTGALPLDKKLIEEIAHGGYVPEDV